MEFVKAQLILDYKHFYKSDPPEDRISLIAHLSRVDILAEIVALNYRLKPNSKLYIDTSLHRQIKELKYFSQHPDYYRKNLNVFRANSSGSVISADYPLVFTRQTCLYAIEEIINSDRLIDIPNLGMPDIHAWENLFKYLLCINSELDIKKGEDYSIENINAKILAVNELAVDTDPALTIYRGELLMQYFNNHEKYHEPLNRYFHDYYEMNFRLFLKNIGEFYFGNPGKYKFFYYTEENGIRFLDNLSTRYPNDTYRRLVSTRKSPFIKIDTDKYLITDLSFLAEKTYYQFINDFWFDYLKESVNEEGKRIYNISNYKSVLGYFFESYVAKILKRSLIKAKYIKLLLFDELKIETKKGLIELADIYIRYGNKIILGQVKSGSIYDNEKYGGDVSALYKGDRNKFFDNFGVNQLISSIINIEKYISELDTYFPFKRLRVIYPVILLNDKVFQTPLMADIFNARFQELISDIKLEKVSIKALSIIQINDLERIEVHLYKNPKSLWWILKKHTRNRRYMIPFSSTLFLLGVPYILPKKIFSAIRLLLKGKTI